MTLLIGVGESLCGRAVFYLRKRQEWSVVFLTVLKVLEKIRNAGR
jgi:hypothetical protein